MRTLLRLFAKGALLGLGCCAASSFATSLPSFAETECPQWSLSGRWEFQLENGRSVGFNLYQDARGSLSGKATYDRLPRSDVIGTLASRVVQGSLRGSKFSVAYLVDDLPEVDNENVFFEGVINADGSLSGRGPDDPDNPRAWKNWREKDGRKAVCMTKRPIKRMGKSKSDAKLTKEECEAEGNLYVPQTHRCIGPALQSALRAACEKKGGSYDAQTTQCRE